MFRFIYYLYICSGHKSARPKSSRPGLRRRVKDLTGPVKKRSIMDSDHSLICILINIRIRQ